MQIDYNNITNYQRSVTELTGFLLWCTVTPGKRSDVITPKFNKILDQHDPTKLVKAHGKTVRTALEKQGIGQYDRIIKCWKQIGQNIKPLGKLKNITREELLAIDGIGPKTASFFIVHSQPWSELAVLDTHILHFLQEQFIRYPVSRGTPQEIDEYKRLEYMFLGIAASQNKTPAELDLEIWRQRSLSQ